MLAHISGTLEAKEKDSVVIDVGGVGYKIIVSNSTLSRLPKVGEKVKLLCEQIVREDSLSLYGFFTKEEKSLFNNLLIVSGVGPKTALAVISSLPLDKLVSAIARGDLGLLTSVPGIGKKTAERIVVELKEKLAKLHGIAADQMGAGLPQESTLISDTISALVSLGYSPREARESIMNLNCNEYKTIEELLKTALKNLT